MARRGWQTAKLREVARLIKEQADQARRLAAGLRLGEALNRAWALQEVTAKASLRSDLLCSVDMSQPVHP